MVYLFVILLALAVAFMALILMRDFRKQGANDVNERPLRQPPGRATPPAATPTPTRRFTRRAPGTEAEDL